MTKVNREKKFSHFNPPQIERSLSYYKKRAAKYWQKEGEKMALRLFRFVYQTVPAYRHFLKKKGYNSNIKTIEEFQRLPTVSKKNYLRAHEYLDLFPNGDITSATTISATSGSTGEPFFFPRDEHHDGQYEHCSEIFLRNQFEIEKKKTLAIVGFGLGIWIGGIFTYKNFNKIAQKGYDLTLIPVGPQKDLYLKAFKKFAPFYDQIILMGYPPFLKDVLDSGIEEGIKWKNHRLRLMTAAEGYSEDFRNYMASSAGIQNPINDIINIYGTVEQGTIAHETAFGNLIRKIASEKKEVAKLLFPRASHIPTLAQYYPQTVYFEEKNDTILATSYGSSIPLVRYAFSDLGGVIPFDEMTLKLKSLGIDIIKEAKKYNIEKTVFKLPFVYVYARSDFAIIFRGANIYPEEIRRIIDGPTLNKDITGRFTVEKKENRKFSQSLIIHIELQKKTKATRKLKNRLAESIVKGLLGSNSEFRDQYQAHPSKTRPYVVLWPYNHHLYFHGQGKQSWVKRK